MISKSSMALVFVAASVLSTHSAYAKQVVCVFDPLGASGEVFALMRDYALASKRWGADVSLKAYTDERVATEDFKAEQCDGLYVTGIRARQFNSFTGSIDALGAVFSNSMARSVLQLMARPQLADDMRQGDYEVAGVLSFGSAYLFTRDSKINTILKMADKKIAVLSHDQAQYKMAQRIGMRPVQSDVNTFGGMFNTGQVDIIGAPAVVFKPFELSKGLGANGAIMRFPVLYVSMNLVIRHQNFPAGYGQKSREWIATQIPRTVEWIDRMEKDIPEKYWQDVPANEYVGYVRMFRESRVELTRSGFYNPKMMKLLKRLRCAQNPNSFECSLNDE